MLAIHARTYPLSGGSATADWYETINCHSLEFALQFFLQTDCILQLEAHGKSLTSIRVSQSPIPLTEKSLENLHRRPHERNRGSQFSSV